MLRSIKTQGDNRKFDSIAEQTLTIEKVANNTAREDDCEILENSLLRDPDSVQLTLSLQRKYEADAADSNFTKEAQAQAAQRARRLRVAIRHVTKEGKHLPPRGPRLIPGDRPPAQIHTPHNRRIREGERAISNHTAYNNPNFSSVPERVGDIQFAGEAFARDAAKRRQAAEARYEGPSGASSVRTSGAAVGGAGSSQDAAAASQSAPGGFAQTGQAAGGTEGVEYRDGIMYYPDGQIDTLGTDHSRLADNARRREAGDQAHLDFVESTLMGLDASEAADLRHRRGQESAESEWEDVADPMPATAAGASSTAAGASSATPRSSGRRRAAGSQASGSEAEGRTPRQRSALLQSAGSGVNRGLAAARANWNQGRYQSSPRARPAAQATPTAPGAQVAQAASGASAAPGDSTGTGTEGGATRQRSTLLQSAGSGVSRGLQAARNNWNQGRYEASPRTQRPAASTSTAAQATQAAQAAPGVQETSSQTTNLEAEGAAPRQRSTLLQSAGSGVSRGLQAARNNWNQGRSPASPGSQSPAASAAQTTQTTHAAQAVPGAPAAGTQATNTETEPATPTQRSTLVGRSLQTARNNWNQGRSLASPGPQGPAASTTPSAQTTQTTHAAQAVPGAQAAGTQATDTETEGATSRQKPTLIGRGLQTARNNWNQGRYQASPRQPRPAPVPRAGQTQRVVQPGQAGLLARMRQRSVASSTSESASARPAGVGPAIEALPRTAGDQHLTPAQARAEEKRRQAAERQAAKERRAAEQRAAKEQRKQEKEAQAREQREQAALRAAFGSQGGSPTEAGPSGAATPASGQNLARRVSSSVGAMRERTSSLCVGRPAVLDGDSPHPRRTEADPSLSTPPVSAANQASTLGQSAPFTARQASSTATPSTLRPSPFAAGSGSIVVDPTPTRAGRIPGAPAYRIGPTWTGGGPNNEPAHIVRPDEMVRSRSGSLRRRLSGSLSGALRAGRKSTDLSAPTKFDGVASSTGPTAGTAAGTSASHATATTAAIPGRPPAVSTRRPAAVDSPSAAGRATSATSTAQSETAQSLAELRGIMDREFTMGRRLDSQMGEKSGAESSSSPRGQASANPVAAAAGTVRNEEMTGLAQRFIAQGAPGQQTRTGSASPRQTQRGGQAAAAAGASAGSTGGSPAQGARGLLVEALTSSTSLPTSHRIPGPGLAGSTSVSEAGSGTGTPSKRPAGSPSVQSEGFGSVMAVGSSSTKSSKRGSPQRQAESATAAGALPRQASGPGMVDSQAGSPPRAGPASLSSAAASQADSPRNRAGEAGASAATGQTWPTRPSVNEPGQGPQRPGAFIMAPGSISAPTETLAVTPATSSDPPVSIAVIQPAGGSPPKSAAGLSNVPSVSAPPASASAAGAAGGASAARPRQPNPWGITPAGEATAQAGASRSGQDAARASKMFELSDEVRDTAPPPLRQKKSGLLTRIRSASRPGARPVTSQGQEFSTSLPPIPSGEPFINPATSMPPLNQDIPELTRQPGKRWGIGRRNSQIGDLDAPPTSTGANATPASKSFFNMGRRRSQPDLPPAAVAQATAASSAATGPSAPIGTDAAATRPKGFKALVRRLSQPDLNVLNGAPASAAPAAATSAASSGPTPPKRGMFGRKQSTPPIQGASAVAASSSPRPVKRGIFGQVFGRNTANVSPLNPDTLSLHDQQTQAGLPGHNPPRPLPEKDSTRSQLGRDNAAAVPPYGVALERTNAESAAAVTASTPLLNADGPIALPPARSAAAVPSAASSTPVPVISLSPESEAVSGDVLAFGAGTNHPVVSMMGPSLPLPLSSASGSTSGQEGSRQKGRISSNDRSSNDRPSNQGRPGPFNRLVSKAGSHDERSRSPSRTDNELTGLLRAAAGNELRASAASSDSGYYAGSSAIGHTSTVQSYDSTSAASTPVTQLRSYTDKSRSNPRSESEREVSAGQSSGSRAASAGPTKPLPHGTGGSAGSAGSAAAKSSSSGASRPSAHGSASVGGSVPRTIAESMAPQSGAAPAGSTPRPITGYEGSTPRDIVGTGAAPSQTMAAAQRAGNVINFSGMQAPRLTEEQEQTLLEISRDKTWGPNAEQLQRDLTPEQQAMTWEELAQQGGVGVTRISAPAPPGATGWAAQGMYSLDLSAMEAAAAARRNPTGDADPPPSVYSSHARSEAGSSRSHGSGGQSGSARSNASSGGRSNGSKASSTTDGHITDWKSSSGSGAKPARSARRQTPHSNSPPRKTPSSSFKPARDLEAARAAAANRYPPPEKLPELRVVPDAERGRFPESPSRRAQGKREGGAGASAAVAAAQAEVEPRSPGVRAMQGRFKKADKGDFLPKNEWAYYPRSRQGSQGSQGEGGRGGSGEGSSKETKPSSSQASR